MSDNQETLRQFCDVTGADENRSRFFLESANWRLEEALSSFYENDGNLDAPPVSTPAPVSIQTLSDSDMDSPPASPAQRPKKEKKKPTNTRFATLGSLQQESSSDEEGQAFYAGGSERSGQQIIGPGKNKNDIVTEMFKSVRERGAVVFEDEPSSSSRRGGGAFAGVGYRLGQTNDDHEEVTPGNATSQDQGARSVRLRLYRGGFTVDDGQLRPYMDPENAHFLSCIRRGEIPPELSSTGGEVRVSLEDHRHEECPKQSSAKQPVFTGKGHMLGSPTPPTVGVPATVASSEDRAANIRAAQQAIKLDESKPATNIQFRLADGSVLTARFNLTHTVGDLTAFVSRAEPSYQLRPFALLTAFPAKELSDPAKTLEEANLLNCTLMQRLK